MPGLERPPEQVVVAAARQRGAEIERLVEAAERRAPSCAGRRSCSPLPTLTAQAMSGAGCPCSGAAGVRRQPDPAEPAREPAVGLEQPLASVIPAERLDPSGADGDARVGRENAPQRRRPARRGHGVVVEEGHHVARRACERAIPGEVEPLDRLAHVAHAGESLGDERAGSRRPAARCPRPGSRPAPDAGRRERVQGARELRRPVVRTDGGRDRAAVLIPIAAAPPARRRRSASSGSPPATSPAE